MSLKSVFEQFDSSISTTEGSIILETRIKPLLKVSRHYHRITAFFSPEVISTIFTELSSCLRSGGSVKLIVGIHDAAKLIPILNEIDQPNPEVRFMQAVSQILHDDIEACLHLLDNRQNIPRLFSELIRQELISIKFACVRKDYERYEKTGCWPANDSLFHPKISIFKDDTDAVVLSGSFNETNKGYGSNVEHIKCINSWDNPGIFSAYDDTFSMMWNDTDPTSRTIPFSNSFRNLLENISRNSANYRRIADNTILEADYIVQMSGNNILLYPHSFTRVRLLPHQKAIYNTVLSRWPVRGLIADEVGLGKTIEAGSVMSYLRQFASISRIVLLVPASLRYQWQSEMWNLFGLDFFIYEPRSKKLVFKPNNRTEREILNVDPDDLFKHGIERILVSWHYVRKPDAKGDYRIKTEDNIDLLLVDEAHAARLKRKGTEEPESTQLFRFLQYLIPSVTHRLFLTATPQQTDFLDYQSLLQLISGYSLEEDSLRRIAKLNSGIRLTTHEKLKAMAEIVDLSNEVPSIPIPVYNHDDPRSALIAYSDNLYITHHPTTIFTLRNTRQLLRSVGYVFPEVNLFSTPVSINEQQQRIFTLASAYIQHILFDFERAALGAKGLGFVKTIYSQRIVSSFRACYDTLRARKEKLEAIIASGYLEQNAAVTLEETEGEEEEGLQTEAVVINEGLANIALRDIRYINEILVNIERNNFFQSEIHDPKITTALKLINRHLEEGDQVIVFSRFTSTTNSIVNKLGERPNLKFGRFQGNLIQTIQGSRIENHSRTSIAEQFSHGDFPLIICSDAASEGLNLQAANVLINVDVPWNPARVLQRFGRIDRFGQKKSVLYFYNLFYPGSVEDIMYSRLHQRNMDFRTVLGMTPEITTSEHIDELVYQNNLILPVPVTEYLNTMIRYTSGTTTRIHNLILKRLAVRPNITITTKTLLIDDTALEYSIDELESTYLDLNHPVFHLLEPVDLTANQYPAYLLKNTYGHSFFLCVKREGAIFPIATIEQLLDYIILGQLSFEYRELACCENNLSELLRRTLNKSPDLLINHNHIRFSTEVIDIYEGLFLERVGILPVHITFSQL